MLPKRPYSAHKTDRSCGYWTPWRNPKYTTAIKFHILHPFTNITFSDRKRCHQLYNIFLILHTYSHWSFIAIQLLIFLQPILLYPTPDLSNISPSFKQLLSSFFLSTLVSSPNILRDLHTIRRTFHRQPTKQPLASSLLITRAGNKGWPADAVRATLSRYPAFWQPTILFLKHLTWEAMGRAIYHGQLLVGAAENAFTSPANHFTPIS